MIKVFSTFSRYLQNSTSDVLLHEYVSPLKQAMHAPISTDIAINTNQHHTCKLKIANMEKMFLKYLRCYFSDMYNAERVSYVK